MNKPDGTQMFSGLVNIQAEGTALNNFAKSCNM